MKYTSIILIFLLSATSYSAEFIPKKLSQMTDDLGVGTHTADTSDPHGASMTQTNLTVGSLTVTGYLNATVPGYIAQTNGTATGTQLTSVQINSGAGTLSAATIAGVAAPYIAQNGGTGTVSSLQSTGNLSITKDGQNKITFKRTTIGSDALSLAMLSVYGSDTTGAETNFANIEASIGSATDNQESGKIALWTMRDGFIDERLSIVGTSAAFGGTGNKVDVEVYGTITARDGIKFTSDNSTLNSGNIVKGIVAGSGISIDQSTGTVTINASGATGGWTDGTNTVYTTVAADKVVIGSTTASGSNILTVVGSTTVNDLSISNALGLGFTGTPIIDMAIGDHDTGLNYVSDGIYDIFANNDPVVRINGNSIDGFSGRVSIGTTTAGTRVNVVGTVTASGFSGNGAGLTNLPGVAFSAVTGSATSEQLPTVLKLYGTTSTQAAGAYGQLYVRSSGGGGGLDSYTKLLLHMNNPGTSTFVDSSDSAHTVTAVGSAIGTVTAKFGSGSLYTSLTGDYLSVPDSEDKNFGSGDFTIDFWVYHNTAIGSTETYIGDTATGSLAFFFSRWSTGVLTLYYGTNGPDWAANQPATTETLSSNTWHHIALVRNGATTYVFIDGVAATLSSNISGTIWNGTGVLNIGNYGANSTVNKVKGYMDELRISKGIARWTSNFTPPVAPYTILYTQYSAQYKDPVNGNTVFEILTPGTATTEASYIYNNATTTVFGLGTNTAITATSTAYSGWFDGAVRATAFNVASTEKIKENIKPIKIKPDLLDAEGMAKQNYIAGAKAAWIVANSGSYTTVINETGTGSVTVVDTAAMESDYKNQKELEWASDLNQSVYTENIQKTYEKGFWQMFDSVKPRSWNPKDKPSLTRKGFVVEDMPDVVKGDDGQSIDPMALIAYISVVQQTLKADTIFALSTLKELITTGTVTQQNIDYCNDRLEVLNP